MALGISNLPLYVIVAVTMGVGSVVAGLRVTRTLAEKVTPITPVNGLVANAVTSLLVGAASRFALPVSTTHVSSGAIIGVGISRGAARARTMTSPFSFQNGLREVRWPVVRELLLAWMMTVPASAALAAAVSWFLR